MAQNKTTNNKSQMNQNKASETVNLVLQLSELNSIIQRLRWIYFHRLKFD
jgi:hypothetical protein